MNQLFEKYQALLMVLTPMLNESFESQKEFIKCRSKCSLCCERGNYPVSGMEFEFMKTGINKLDENTQISLKNKAEKIFEEKEKFVGMGNIVLKFKYECPFLFENLCSIYEFRPIICRTQGLILQSIHGENQFNVPACMNAGLNYANVWDENINYFSAKKIKEQNIKTDPQAFDLSYESLLQIFGIDCDFLEEKIQDTESDDIRMIFEWALKGTIL